MIKALIFDLDDTLYNERTYVFGAFYDVAKYIGEAYSFDVKKVYDDLLNIFYREGRGKVFNVLCENYEIDEDIKKLVDIYRNSKPPLELYEDGKEILIWGKREGFKLGIITDGDSKVQWNKIKALNLKNMVDDIIVSDDLGRKFWKPHEKPYIEIIKKIGCSKEESVYIGDNPNKDFIGAKKLGIKTIRVIRQCGDHMKTRLDNEYEADYEITNLEEIKYIINSIR